MREVAIVGLGCTRFGEMWDKSFRDLFIEAGLMALEDAGMSGAQVEALYGGNMSSGIFIQQEHVGALIADYSGLIPTTCQAREWKPRAPQVVSRCEVASLRSLLSTTTLLSPQA